MNINEDAELTILEFLELLETEGGTYQIDTPQGWVDINTFYKRGIRDCFIVKSETHELTCASRHLLLSQRGWIDAKDLNVNEDVLDTDNGVERPVSLETTHPQEVFDILIDSPEHAYYANGIVSHNSGKTSCVRKIAEDCGYSRVYHQNGTRDMTVSTFFGNHTMLIDETSMQSYVTFKKAELYLALIHGTELDDSGNQILYNSKLERVYDDSGLPKVVGAPAIYFLDEFSVVQPEVFTSVFNRALEVPDNPGCSRTVEIPGDGGRIVKSHPGFAVILSSNLLGKGIENDAQAGYTGQNNQHDDSTLDRIDAIYEFGYNLDAERNIMTKLLVNDKEVDKLIKFVEKVRQEWALSTIETLLSPRQILQLCKQIRIYREGSIDDPIGAAMYDVIFTGLRTQEKQAWNQSVNLMFNIDVLKKYENMNSKSMYIPRRSNSQVI